MNKEKTYYEKILVTSGEVPEADGSYYVIVKNEVTGHLKTKEVAECYDGEFTGIPIKYTLIAWLKEVSVPSPKQEAVEFVRRILKEGYAPSVYPDGDLWSKIDSPEEEVKTEQLYDKFKEKGEK